MVYLYKGAALSCYVALLLLKFPDPNDYCPICVVALF
jgi:hypothetical protein